MLPVIEDHRTVMGTLQAAIGGMLEAMLEESGAIALLDVTLPELPAAMWTS
jgi:hypothetical protein